jgi:hypothetical protein
MCSPRRKRRNRQLQTRTLTHTHTHTKGGIEALVAAMGRHAESRGVQEEAAFALGHLAYNHPENQRKIGAQVANAYEYICEKKRRNLQERRNRQSQTHTLTHTHTHTKGGIEALVAAMGRHAAHRQEQAAVALLIIAFNHPENQRKIGAQVANAHAYICALPRGREQLSSSLQAFQQAAGALRNLSANHPENQRKILCAAVSLCASCERTAWVCLGAAVLCWRQ